jgi:peptidyl-prolyl cis-trans isomerase SurA
MTSRMRTPTAPLLVLLLSLPLGGRPAAQGRVIEQVLVKVNGDIITQTDLEARQAAAVRDRLRQDVDPKVLKNDEALKKLVAEVTPRVIVEAIDELLLIQLGREKGYHLSDEQFRDIVNNLRKEQNLQEEAKFQAALKAEGMTIDDLRKNIEKQMLISRVQQDEVGSKLQITEEEARQYYLTHQREFAQPATVTLREILIEVPGETKQGQKGVSVGRDDEVALRAAEIRKRIVSGADFAIVASEVSTSASKANGGLIGPIAVSDLSPALQQLLQQMKPGDITEPLHVQRGYQILKLETLKPSTIPPFESVRDVAAEKVTAARQQSEIRKFLTRVRSQAIIEWKNAELKKAYEQELATSPSPAPPSGS